MITDARNVNEQVAGDKQVVDDGEGGNNGNQEGDAIQGEFNEADSKEVIIAMKEEEEEEEEARIMEAGVKEGRAVDVEDGLNSNLNLREVNMGGPSDSERAAIAKRKKPMYDGPDLEKLKNRLLRPFSNSGSDSFDPDMDLGLEGGGTGKWWTNEQGR